MAHRRFLVFALVLTTAFAPSAARAASPAPGPNAVVLWNSNAQNEIYEVAREGPFVASRSFAMVQGAVYDAVNSIAGTPYEPYLIAPPARRTDSADAAVAAAAGGVLLSLYPGRADAIRERYAAALARIPDGRSKSGGVAVGDRAAAAMIAARAGDGAYSGATWTVGTAPGQWRPTPPSALTSLRSRV